MKVKFINRLLGIRIGGGEIFDLNIADHLKKLGCEVSFITGCPLFGKIPHSLGNFRTDYVRSPYLRDLSYKMSKGTGRLMALDLNLFEERAFKLIKVQCQDIDIVQLCSLPNLAVRIENELNVPTVVRFPGPPSLRVNSKIRTVAAVIANGDAYRYIKVNIRDDVVNIPPGINSEKFIPIGSDIRNRYSISQKELLLLYVGRFIPLKNLTFLIDAFYKVARDNKSIKLMLVGEGSLKHRIESRVKKYRLSQNVIFTGAIDNNRLPQFYSAADIFVISSTYDNFPNAILEAMSCELPIVATRVGGIPMQVEKGINGFLVESNSVPQLCDAVLKLASDADVRHRIGVSNRRKVVQNYNWLRSGRKLLRLYEYVLRKRS